MARKAGIDEQFFGDEPTLTEDATDSQVIRAWNWYNYFHDHEDAKKYVLAYLKQQNKLELLEQIEKVHSAKLTNIGWNCRLLTKGSKLPRAIKLKTLDRIVALAKEEAAAAAKKAEEEAKPVSIQDRVASKANDLIGSLEEQIDVFLIKGKNDFNPEKWFQENNIKPAIAKRISEFYSPLYSELFDAHKGVDDQLKEAYSSWKKSNLKKYMEFVKSIVSTADQQSVAVKVERKPRKKKVKPAAVLAARLQYKAEDKDYNLTSIKPTDVVGAQQLWFFNTRYRTLSVLMALGPAGLSIKGTTITGFDEKTSISKKLRKPKEVLSTVVEAGKVPLKSLMGQIKSKAVKAKGRINSEVVLLRAIK
jgi:uncharacterized protein YciI